MLAENRDEDGMEELDISLGMVSDPEEEARKALRAHQEATGMTFENPDSPVPGDGKLWSDGDLPWR